MKNYNSQKIPQSRIATFDVFEVSSLKHHISALLEFDVTDSRLKIRELRRAGKNVSFNAWLIKAISTALLQHKEAASFLQSKKKLVIFNDVNVSMVVEKTINGNKVPIPLVIKKTNEKSSVEITREIENAKSSELSNKDIVINRRPGFYEKLYYHLPGSMRRLIWRYIIRHPKLAYKTMGNVSVTSLGMIGKINGWFIHKSVHPISFGIGSVVKKPVVVNNEIKIREVLNVTVLIDHDVVDGAPMVRFLNTFAKLIEGNNEI